MRATATIAKPAVTVFVVLRNLLREQFSVYFLATLHS